MAFYDWNRNGKKNMTDDFFVYNIFKNSENQKRHAAFGFKGLHIHTA